MSSRFTITGIFKGIDNFSKIAGRVENSTGRLNGGMMKGFKSMSEGAKFVTDGIGQIATVAATAGAALGTLAAVGLFEVMKASNAVADQAARIESVLPKMSGTVVQSAEEMKAAALDWSKHHKTTAEEFLKSSYMMISAGLNQAQSLAGSRTASLVASATFGDAGAAAEALAVQYNTLGDKSKDVNVEMGRLGDVMTRTQQLFQYKDLAQVTDGLKYATPTAKMFGQSLEELNTAMGMLNNAGIVGTSAGTAYSAMMQKMIPASRELGFAIAHNKDGVLDFGGTLSNIHKKFGDFDKASDSTKASLEEAFGRRGIVGIALLSDKAGEFADNLAKISDNAGAAGKAAAIIESKGSGPIDILMNKFTAAKVAMGNALTPDTSPMVTGIGNVVDSVTTWVTANQGLISGGIQDALSAAVPIVTAFGDAFMESWPQIKQAVADVFDGVRSFNAFFGQQGPSWQTTVKKLAIVFGELAAGAIGVAAVFGGMLFAGIQVVVGIAETLTAAWHAMIHGIGAAIFAVDNFLANLGAKWDAFDFGALASSLIDGLVNGITAGVSKVVDAVKGLGSEALAALKGAWDSHSPSVKFGIEGDNAAMGVANGITAGITKAVSASQALGDQVLSNLSIKAPAVDTSAIAQFGAIPGINARSLGSDYGDDHGDQDSARASSQGANQPQVASAQAATLAAITTNNNTTTTGEITVRAEPGSSAAVTKQPTGFGLKVAPSGGM